jgi:hypothetical protein
VGVGRRGVPRLAAGECSTGGAVERTPGRGREPSKPPDSTASSGADARKCAIHRTPAPARRLRQGQAERARRGDGPGRGARSTNVMTLTEEETMTQTYSYAATLAASERITWRVEDLIGGDKRLDFTRSFLPESLARVERLRFLGPAEKRTLNQVRGLGYLYMFGLVEEFILPFVLDHVRPSLGGDDYRVRAFLEFAAEEAKHIQLFRRFRREFEAGFGTPCAVIGPPDAIARAVLAHDPLAVALTILHIEWMTQRHYIDSVQDDQALDPQFKSLLKHHWMEEAQHAKLDTLMVEALAEGRTADEVERAIEGYLDIGMLVAGGLEQQVAFDLASFELATGRALAPDEREAFQRVQRQAQRWTFLGSGMTHPNFLATVERIRPGARARLEPIAQGFC